MGGISLHHPCPPRLLLHNRPQALALALAPHGGQAVGNLLINSSHAPAEAQKPLGKTSLAELTKNTGSGHLVFFFFFGVIYFLNPLVVWVQLESRTYQGREGGRVSRIPRQLWREAPGPCSQEVGPVRLSAGSGEAGSPSVQVSPAEESCPLLDLHPHRPSQRFPKRAPSS